LLDNVPAVTKNNISISLLDKNGFMFAFGNNGCEISKMVYGSRGIIDGLYLLDLNRPVCSIDGNNKRPKISNTSITYRWHCRLGHINENRIKKMHEHGCLGQFDLE